MVRPKVILLFSLLAVLATFSFVRLNPPPVPPSLQPFEIPFGRLQAREGNLYRRTANSPFSGFIFEHYSGGARKSRAEVLDGKLHGLSEGWHTNGVRQIQEHFVEGVSHGQRTKWHANGQKQSQAKIISGKINGTFKRWDENGTLIEEIEMLDNKPHGFSHAFYPSGYLKVQARLTNGEVVQRQTWKDGEKKLN